MYQYPYGDTQQLNLDWILTKIKELETGSGNIDMEEVANTLISATYNASNAYRRYDYCYYNGKLYRCLSDTTGAFNPADWQEVLIGDDIPILTRLINAVDASLTSLQNTAVTNVRYDAGYLKKTINGSETNIIQVQDTPTNDSAKLPSSKAVYDVNSAISTEITNRTNADNALQGQIVADIQTSTTANRAYAIGEYFVLNGTLYRVIAAIANGGTITTGTNAKATNVGIELHQNNRLYYLDCGTFTGTSDAEIIEQALRYASTQIADTECCVLLKMFRQSAWGIIGYCEKTSTFIAGSFTQIYEGKIYIAQLFNNVFSVTKTFS